MTLSFFRDKSPECGMMNKELEELSNSQYFLTWGYMKHGDSVLQGYTVANDEEISTAREITARKITQEVVPTSLLPYLWPQFSIQTLKIAELLRNEFGLQYFELKGKKLPIYTTLSQLRCRACEKLPKLKYRIFEESTIGDVYPYGIRKLFGRWVAELGMDEMEKTTQFLIDFFKNVKIEDDFGKIHAYNTTDAVIRLADQLPERKIEKRLLNYSERTGMFILNQLNRYGVGIVKLEGDAFVNLLTDDLATVEFERQLLKMLKLAGDRTRVQYIVNGDIIKECTLAERIIMYPGVIKEKKLTKDEERAIEEIRRNHRKKLSEYGLEHDIIETEEKDKLEEDAEEV